MGSHSLRIGGATALFNAVGSIDVVKRFGRWRSSAFQSYLWEGDQHAQGISKAMASHSGKLWAEQRLGVAAAAEHYSDATTGDDTPVELGKRPRPKPQPPQLRHCHELSLIHI